MLPPAYVAGAAGRPRTRASRPLPRLVMLQRGPAFLVAARAALARGEPAGFRIGLQRVQDVLVEAGQTLDAVEEGAIAVNLAQLTDFLVRRLDAADDVEGAHGVEEVLLAWDRVAAGYRDLARRRARP